MKLSVGESAPFFSAPDQNGTVHTLESYKEKWILLWFYPKDFTSGCTTEACSLRDNFAELQKSLTVIGVSADSVESHKQFADKYSLQFTLLADPKKKLLHAYGTDGLLFAKRTSFLIDPNGKIQKIYEKVNPEMHADEIIADLATLQ